MKRFTSVTLFLSTLFMILVLSPRGAYADPVTLTFNGTPTGASAGGEYIYPYDFTIQQGSKTFNNVELMCISLNNSIIQGETWTADVFAAGVFGKQYEEAAYLYSVAAAGTANVADAQWAAWSLFDPAATFPGDVNTADVSQLLADAAANYGSFGNYLVFRPESGTQSWGGEPQWFIGDPGVAPVAYSTTPEPGTLTLLGTSLLGLASLLYFRKRNTSDVTRF